MCLSFDTAPFLISAHAELCFVSLYIIYYSDGLLVVSKY